MKKKLGAPRKYEYKGEKRNVTIRLTDEEKQLILEQNESLQAWIQKCLKKLKE